MIELPDITKKQKKQIQTFIEDALEFNKTHNIFVRKSKEDVYERDVIDCFPLVKKITPNKTVLDLGSGGGFPGILLAIIKQKNKIFLLFFINISFTTSCYFHSSNFLHNLSKFSFVLNFNLYFKACKFFIYSFSIYISYINARSCKN